MKDAYYFPHFYNARNDDKILKLRRILGLEGYGAYFCILEMLRGEKDFSLPLESIENIAFELRKDKEYILTIINSFDLFIIDNNEFFSPKLIDFLQPYLMRKEKARVAGIASGRHRKLKLNSSSAQAEQVKESKVKESKVKELKKVNQKKKKVAPKIEEVMEYFRQKGYSIEIAKKAFEYYNMANWKDSTGKPVLNWKQKMIAVWFKPEHEVKIDHVWKGSKTSTDFIR